MNPWYQNVNEEIIPTVPEKNPPAAAGPKKTREINFTTDEIGVENPNQILKLFMDPDVEILNEVPDGNKSNGPYFVLKNPNLEKYQNYQPFKHPKDDINNYEKRVTKTAVYELKNDILVKCDDLDFSFSDRNFVSGESGNGSSLELSNRELFVVLRVYQKHKTFFGFEKKTLYFLETPENFSDIKDKIFVEYNGIDYRQNPENVIEKIENESQNTWDLDWDDLNGILSLLMDSSVQGLDEIPKGEKTNAQFVLKNANIERYKRGLTFKYPKDDRGSWSTNGGNALVYELKNDSTTFERFSKLDFSIKERKYILAKDAKTQCLNAEELIAKSGDLNLFVVFRYHLKNKKYPEFRKRYLYFLETPERFNLAKSKIFVDYDGIDLLGDDVVVTKPKDHQCDYCGQFFISVENLEKHEVAKHTNNLKEPKKNPICDICGKSFTNTGHLNRHISQVHRTKNVQN